MKTGMEAITLSTGTGPSGDLVILPNCWSRGCFHTLTFKDTSCAYRLLRPAPTTHPGAPSWLRGLQQWPSLSQHAILEWTQAAEALLLTVSRGSTAKRARCQFYTAVPPIFRDCCVYRWVVTHSLADSNSEDCCGAVTAIPCSEVWRAPTSAPPMALCSPCSATSAAPRWPTRHPQHSAPRSKLGSSPIWSGEKGWDHLFPKTSRHGLHWIKLCPGRAAAVLKETWEELATTWFD